MSETWSNLFKRNQKIGKDTNDFWEYFWDLDIVQDNSKRTYLKRMAIDRVLNFVSKTVSTTSFKYTVDNKKSTNKEHQEWSYKLNVRPNRNQNASDFWQKVIYKLLYDNEVLIVMNDSEDFLIADSFNRTQYAMFDDTFSEVAIGTYVYERSFNRSDVLLYMQYNNADLENFIAGLYGDYGELFGRMIEVNMRNNQIRGAVDIDVIKNLSTGDDDEKEKKGKVQNYINKVTNAIKNNSVALYPKYKGIGFDETVSKSNSNQTVDELKKLKNDFISEVAGAIGVPPSLILGDMAQAEEQTEFFLKFTIKPLINKIQSELNAKLIHKDDYMKGNRIRAIGPDTESIIGLADKIDKVISSGGFNKNEIRYEFGFDSVDGGDEFILTKNYEKEQKGGENVDEDD